VGDFPKRSYAPLAADRVHRHYFERLFLRHCDSTGKPVPVMGENPGATIQPRRSSSGSDVPGRRTGVLGTATLEMLHKKVGESVVVNSGRSIPRPKPPQRFPRVHESSRRRLASSRRVAGRNELRLIPLFERDIFDCRRVRTRFLIRFGRRESQSAQKVPSNTPSTSRGGGGNSPGNLFNSVGNVRRDRRLSLVAALR